MLSPQLRPLGELVLAAGGIHLRANLHELTLQHPVLGRELRGCEARVQAP